ncbi:MAG: 5'/3'-nucleotidase SurE [Anaerolineae bacterium]
MRMQPRPLILLTNDDGIYSPGLAALARSVADLGDILIVAPYKQQSAMGRSLAGVGTIEPVTLDLGFTPLGAYSVEGTPALAVRTAIAILAAGRITLAVAGINYGENIGVGITTSGTLGAAIEAASYDIPSLAISLETDVAHHFSHSDEVDFSVASLFARRAVIRALQFGIPPSVGVVKVDIPCDANASTPWRLTKLTRQRYYESTLAKTESGDVKFTGYVQAIDLASLEPDSDAHALLVDRVVAVSPLSIDLSARMTPGTDTNWQPL